MNYARQKTIQLKQLGKLVMAFKESMFNAFFSLRTWMNLVEKLHVHTVGIRLNIKAGNNGIIHNI